MLLQAEDDSTWTFDGRAWVRAWTAASIPLAPGGVFVFDPGRNRDILLRSGPPGGETWEWDGRSWQLRTIGSSPYARGWWAGTYSPDLHATVLSDLGQTWIYDGSSWRYVETAHSPDLSAVQYDPIRHSIVGLSLRALGEPDELAYQTWVFDGKDWASLALTGETPLVTSGMGRQNPAIAFDQDRGQWVVFGGFDGTNYFSDTWLGDGSAWKKASDTTSPSERVAAKMAWDPHRHRVLMFGGASGLGDLTDTWSWAGNAWALVVPNPSPSPPTAAGSIKHQTGYWPGGSSLSPDGNGGLVLISAPSSASSLASDTATKTWRWDGNTWREIQTRPSLPRNFVGGLVLDVARKRVLAYGSPNGNPNFPTGREETWSFDGSRWAQLSPAHQPPPMSLPSLAYDDRLKEVVLFGVLHDPTIPGSSGFRDDAETWMWNGTDWAQLHPAASPPPRYGATMVFDQALGGLVLVGGWTARQGLTSPDTWAFDGQTWSLIDSSGPKGDDMSAAWDPVARRLLVFVPPGDTYAFDGAAWSTVHTNPFPSSGARSGALAQLVLEPVHGHVMALMILSGNAVLWRWDGSRWTLVWPSELGTWRRYVSPSDFAFAYPPFWYQLNLPGIFSSNNDSPFSQPDAKTIQTALFLEVHTLSWECSPPSSSQWGEMSQSATKLGGLDAARYRVTEPPQFNTPQVLLVQADRSGNCYSLKLWAYQASVLDAAAPLFDQIVASFRFEQAN